MPDRDSNLDLYCYQTNWIHINNKFNNNNDNLNNNLHDSTDEDTLRHTFRYALKDCQFVHFINRICPLLTDYINVLFHLAQTALMTTPKIWFILSLAINVSCSMQEKHLKSLIKKFNMHNYCFRNPTAYYFCKILNVNFSKGYRKYSSCIVSMIKK